MSTTTPAATKYKADVAAYAAVQHHYRVLGAIVEHALKRATRELGMEAIVQVRTKELASFAEKTIRKQDDYRGQDPINMMTDLCGARVITESTNDIGPVCAFIRKHFEIDEPNSEDTAVRLGVGEFGYRSVHFIVSLKQKEFAEEIAVVKASDPKAAAIIPKLFERRTPPADAGQNFDPGPCFRMEIQVRSLLQHTWANLYHDRVYKSQFKLPTDLKRELMRIAAILEDADQNFSRAIGTVDGYREYYGTYLPQEQLKDELAKLKQVRDFDDLNLKLALKTARVAVSLERWKDVVEILEPFVNEWEAKHSATLDAAMATQKSAETSAEQRRAREALEDLRNTQAENLLLDYGTALWRLGGEEQKARGRLCLSRAVGLDLCSADALIALGDTYDEDDNPKGKKKALDLYRKAFEVNPLEPRAVRGYLQLTAEKKGKLDFVSPMRPTLHNVIERCRERAALGIYLPWAYYDIGCFSLLLGEPYEGVTAYAKAVELSHSDSPIEASLKRARRVGDAIEDTEASEWPLLERLLLIGKVAKRYRLVENALAAVRAKVEALDKLGKEADEAARAELDEAQAKAQKLRAEADAECSEITRDIASRKCPKLRGNVVIVAGGCAPGDEQRLREYAPLLRRIFHDFAGTLFSGGTCSGIGKMVGDLPASSRGPILKVTCLPEVWPSNHIKHGAYEPDYTYAGQGFSPLGAVQVWADILNQGIVPSTVRVIGISGGKLAGFEYRLALMMGAKVGVLKGSGRAADSILEDPDWKDHPNLILLPYDPQTVKVFAAGVSSEGIFTEAQREEAARSQHQTNVKKRRLDSVGDSLPENQPWDSLRPDLKDSIRERVDYIVAQLRAVGLRIVKQGEIPPGATPVEEFDEKIDHDKIEIMAEMEHGRWYVQKCFSGWRLGAKKDETLHTHPDLIAWDLLKDKDKEKDRHYARQIPSVLRDQGYAIVPAEAAGGSEGV